MKAIGKQDKRKQMTISIRAGSVLKENMDKATGFPLPEERDKQGVVSRNPSVQALTVLVSEMLYRESLLAELAMYIVILSLCCFTLLQFWRITQP